jgi:hypothetical protein
MPQAPCQPAATVLSSPSRHLTMRQSLVDSDAKISDHSTRHIAGDVGRERMRSGWLFQEREASSSLAVG